MIVKGGDFKWENKDLGTIKANVMSVGLVALLIHVMGMMVRKINATLHFSNWVEF